MKQPSCLQHRVVLLVPLGCFGRWGTGCLPCSHGTDGPPTQCGAAPASPPCPAWWPHPRRYSSHAHWQWHWHLPPPLVSNHPILSSSPFGGRRRKSRGPHPAGRPTRCRRPQSSPTSSSRCEGGVPPIATPAPPPPGAVQKRVDPSDTPSRADRHASATVVEGKSGEGGRRVWIGWVGRSVRVRAEGAGWLVPTPDPPHLPHTRCCFLT